MDVPVVQNITGVSDQGDGVGVEEASGIQIHVPFALPGEQLLVEIWERDFLASQKWKATKKEPKWPVFGQQVELLKPSEQRVTPQCAKFFGACGGCKQQHLLYPEQLHHKQKRIEVLFSDRQHSPQMQLRPIMGADDSQDKQTIYHYRNKMEFTCSTGRWLLDSDKVQEEADDGDDSSEPSQLQQPQQQFPFTIGLFPISSTSVRRARQQGGKRRRGKGNASWSPRILSIDACSLQDPAGNAILKQLSTRLEAAELEAYNFQTNRGFLKQLVIRKGVNADKQTEIMIGLVTTSLDGEQSDRLKSVIDELVHDFHETNVSSHVSARIVSVVQCLDEQTLRLQGRDGAGVQREQTLFGQPFFHDTILDHSFQVSFGSFFQPNTAQASRLYREIQQTMSLNQSADASAASNKKPVIWDLFCGVGSIGICMGQFASKVYGFEIVEAAVEKAKLNAQLNGYSPEEMQFFTMDLTKRWDENEWSDRVENPDIVIVDPPRAGLHNKLIKLLRRLGPPQICYVSCNPESQVRDLELLCKEKSDEDDPLLSSYEVEFVQPVDMLPHTPHIETIAWLRRRS